MSRSNSRANIDIKGMIKDIVGRLRSKGSLTQRTGIKRSHKDLPPIPKRSKSKKSSRSSSKNKSTGSKGTKDTKASSKATSQRKNFDPNAPVLPGLYLGSKKVDIGPIFFWKDVPKESILQLKIDEKGTNLIHNEKIVGLLKTSVLSSFDSLRKQGAIVYEVKKLDDKNVTISFWLSQNYGLAGSVETLEGELRSAEAEKVVQGFRSLFSALKYEKTKGSSIDQFFKEKKSKKLTTGQTVLASQSTQSANSTVQKASKASKNTDNTFAMLLSDSANDTSKSSGLAKLAGLESLVPKSNKREEEVKKDQGGKETLDRTSKEGNYHQSNSHEILPHPKLPEFTSKLRNYQIYGLNWMLSKEGKQVEGQISGPNNESMHPKYEEWTMKDGSKIYLNILNAQLSMECPETENTLGGILADDMGLGKTVTTIALILSNPWKKDTEFTSLISAEDHSDTEVPSKKPNIAKKSKKASFNMGGTLIVCPSTIRDQWEAEFRKHTEMNSLEVLIYDETKHKNFKAATFSKYDVVIVSYNTLYTGKKLQRLNWHRVVLDEPHYIKTSMNLNSQALHGFKTAISELNAKYRWALGRTFSHNKLVNADVMLRFLRIDPWGINDYFLAALLEQARSSHDLLNSVLKPIMLRRSKESLSAADLSAIELPPKKVEIKYLKLQMEEEEAYAETKSEAVSSFLQFYEKKNMPLDPNAPKKDVPAHVLKKIMRMRQACDHHVLVKFNKKTKEILGFDIAMKLKAFFEERGIFVEADETQIAFQENEYGVSIKAVKDKIDSLIKNEVGQCAICLDEPEGTIAFTICGHTYCDECLADALAHKGLCPSCRTEIREDDKLVFRRAYLDPEAMLIKKSSKVYAVIESVVSIAKQEEKCVCFTQSAAMIDILVYEMGKTGIKSIRIDENCNSEKKNKFIKEFSENEETTVLIVNSMLTGAWVSLTSANHVLFVEPWWNPKMEEQAINLVHRSGQVKPVYVTRFVCKGTIEERMMSLQEDKEKDKKQVSTQAQGHGTYNKFKYLLDL